MVEQGASDLHLRVGEPPIVRHHGEMTRMAGHAPLTNDQLSDMIRSIMPERNRIEFAEANDSDYAYEIAGCARFRANAARDRNGAVSVFRQIPATVVTVEQMNITEEVQRLCYLTKGLVLVTGPTGSGKSTTLCALVDLVNRSRSDHVITIEDPIEFVHPNKACIITQRQVGVTPSRSSRRSAPPCARTPTSFSWAKCAIWRRCRSPLKPPRPGTWCLARCIRRPPRAQSTASSINFRRTARSRFASCLPSRSRVSSHRRSARRSVADVAAREVLLSMPSVTNLIREAKTFQINSVIQTSKRLGMVTLNDALIHYVDAGQVEPRRSLHEGGGKNGLRSDAQEPWNRRGVRRIGYLRQARGSCSSNGRQGRSAAQAIAVSVTRPRRERRPRGDRAV